MESKFDSVPSLTPATLPAVIRQFTTNLISLVDNFDTPSEILANDDKRRACWNWLILVGYVIETMGPNSSEETRDATTTALKHTLFFPCLLQPRGDVMRPHFLPEWQQPVYMRLLATCHSDTLLWIVQPFRMALIQLSPDRFEQALSNIDKTGRQELLGFESLTSLLFNYLPMSIHELNCPYWGEYGKPKLAMYERILDLSVSTTTAMAAVIIGARRKLIPKEAVVMGARALAKFHGSTAGASLVSASILSVRLVKDCQDPYKFAKWLSGIKYRSRRLRRSELASIKSFVPK